MSHYTFTVDGNVVIARNENGNESRFPSMSDALRALQGNTCLDPTTGERMPMPLPLD